MENVAVIGLGLAKSVFQVHGIDDDSEVVLRLRSSSRNIPIIRLVVITTPGVPTPPRWPDDIIWIIASNRTAEMAVLICSLPGSHSALCRPLNFHLSLILILRPNPV